MSLSADAGTLDAALSLRNFLEYGISGLALAILLVSYFSIYMFQHRALSPHVDKEKIDSFVGLQNRLLTITLIIFLSSLIVPRVFETIRPEPGKTHLSFSISPAEFNNEKLMPKLSIASEGKKLSFASGTLTDTAVNEKSYTLIVDALTQEIARLQLIAVRKDAAGE